LLSLYHLFTLYLIQKSEIHGKNVDMCSTGMTYSIASTVIADMVGIFASLVELTTVY
jgi:hypothetical protein